MTLKLLPLVLFLGLVGCGGEDDDGGSPDAAYSTHVSLVCNGSVLLDMTFTTKAACESHKAANTYMCGGSPLTFSC